VGLLRESWAIALNWPISANLDTVGNSQPCRQIQDRALEPQFFELIINLASLQPIAEGRLGAEDNRLRQNPAIIVTPSPPLWSGSDMAYASLTSFAPATTLMI
jgi:hypothetical protein